jgi:hypothetical protein
MVSKAFFTGSKYLVEENDGRRDYLRLDGERFLAALSAAGQKVLQAPFEADEQKSAYLKALVEINESYFAAREYEDDAKGKYLKHDERAERQFRIETAERFSDATADLRTLLLAHDALVVAVVEQVEETREGDERRRALSAVRSTLLACTDRAVSEGWFPVVETYYYSLSPGELVAEDRERRKQRIDGTEESRGIKELLEEPRFDRLTERDLERVRELNRESPGPDARVWKRLLDEYPWYVGGKRG